MLVAGAAALGSHLSEDANDDAYTVQYMPAGSLRDSPDATNVPSENWVTMTAANGTRYDCAIANAGGTSAAEIRAARAKLVGTTLPAATRDKVHKMLEGTCVMSGKGWWVYEACWGRQVRQYHQGANDKIETEYALGLGPSHGIEKGATRELEFGESPLYGMYASATYYNGTECDLTGEQRETELRITCASDDAESPLGLSDAAEPSTCKYL
eukprot:CAMPEP_0174851382 /NCGR_PEP_ID=MMETSP1114-20130205/23164_1 /TAXON_ID=312471 /ORGANISM="Neobodo designis, Strain CCAP 1951/1" /LENGTH=211 /DNA_ID=CAMNT_0016085917 /DNA_START=1 /DNA_END=633 /DNA_ORIENTATION=-